MGPAGGRWKLVLEGRDRGGLGKFQEDLWNHQLAEAITIKSPCSIILLGKLSYFTNLDFPQIRPFVVRKLNSLLPTLPIFGGFPTLPICWGFPVKLQSGSVRRKKQKIHQGSTQRQARSPNRQIAGNDNDSQFGTLVRMGSPVDVFRTPWN